MTGANTGIGLQTAKFLARLGAEVYISKYCPLINFNFSPAYPSFLAVRDDAKGQASLKEIKKGQPNAKVEYLKCELASLKSVRQFVEEYKTRVN